MRMSSLRGILLVLACLDSIVLSLGASADIQSGQAVSSPFFVYPEASTSANPRVPCIPPEPRLGGGNAMEVDAVFQYPLAPFVVFPEGGVLTADIRDNTRRKEYDLLSLIDGTRQLALRIGRTPEGKIPRIVYLENGREIASGALKNRFSTKWTRVQLRWAADRAEVTIDNGESASISLPAPIEPKSLSLPIWQVDELQVKGGGAFSLDWENGYTASVTPVPGGKSITASLLGFDAYVISQDPTKRDFPMLQVLNGGEAESLLSVQFALTGEVTNKQQNWVQKIRVPGRAAILVPVLFPQPLASDVYHLRVDCDLPIFNEPSAKHFLFVEPLPDKDVIPKFGLHDSDRTTFGFWPDTLPIHLYHIYSRWAFIYGPAWEKENTLPPDSAPEELNWNPRIEWGIRQGLTPFVSLNSIPDTDWMREREYEAAKMKIFPWGRIGGFPNLTRYEEFLKLFAKRYKDKVSLYEIENEPMAYLGGIPAEDYALLARVTSKTIHSINPDARVFGISGTGHFLPWMANVFAANGAENLNGVSIHTYVTPRPPEAALLPGKLAEVHEVAGSNATPLALLNSETGTFVALREAVDHPISEQRLQELIQQGVPPFFVPSGWPNYAIDERSGGISIVRNAVYNFLAGAEYFTFFGWNNLWPAPDWWGKPSEACFAMISSSREGERTPSQYTLAIAVLTEQLKAAQQMGGRPVTESGVSGGLFPTLSGGEVAVIWSVQGKRNVLVENASAPIEAFTMLGQKVALPFAGRDGLVRLEVDQEPLYIHTTKAGLHFLPSPVIGIAADVSGAFRFTLVNRYDKEWSGKLKFTPPRGWRVTPSEAAFHMNAQERAAIQAACEIPRATPRGSYNVEATITLPEGDSFKFPIPMEVRPSLIIPRAAKTFAWRNIESWQSLKPVFAIDKPEQVVVGQPPLLASLQEERFWKGPAELSANARFASDGTALFLCLEVTDTNRRPPSVWPGVLGSSIEIFLDQRTTGAGLGTSSYGKGVTQLLINPAPGTQPLVCQATDKFGVIEGIESTGGNLPDGKYWVALCIPLQSPGSPFGLDVGINGPPKGGEGRKSQLMLFGSQNNNKDASRFGMATTSPAVPSKPEK